MTAERKAARLAIVRAANRHAVQLYVCPRAYFGLGIRPRMPFTMRTIQRAVATCRRNALVSAETLKTAGYRA